MAWSQLSLLCQLSQALVDMLRGSIPAAWAAAVYQHVETPLYVMRGVEQKMSCGGQESRAGGHCLVRVLLANGKRAACNLRVAPDQ